jgi:peptidoglycan/LPS O-acetylase OafA/YrhL
MTQRGSRIPSLDGLRAISIAAVLLGHLAGTRGFPDPLSRLIRNQHVDIAHLGVRVFFVISGFLITGLLVEEHARTGAISLKRFYLRRTMRIFPAYFALLAIVALLDARRVIDVSTSDFVHALTYTMNYAPDRGWYLGHLWSLAVEEQFYLLWPAVMLLAAPRRALHVALAVVCVVPVIRVVQATFWHGWLPMVGTTFETSADAIAVGCVLALARESLWNRVWYRGAVESSWMAPALLVVGLLLGLRYRPGILLGESLVNVAIVLVVDRVVRHPEQILGRILNTRALVFIGTLSYSIYLWQQLFLNRASPSALAAFPLNLLLALAAAMGSYYLVERPFLRWRPRLEERWFGTAAPVAAVQQATGL